MHITAKGPLGGASAGQWPHPREPRIGSDLPNRVHTAKRSVESNQHDKTRLRELRGLRRSTRQVESCDSQCSSREPSVGAVRMPELESSLHTQRSHRLRPSAEQVVQMFAKGPSSMRLVDEEQSWNDSEPDVLRDNHANDSSGKPRETPQRKRNVEWKDATVSRDVLTDLHHEALRSSASKSLVTPVQQGATAHTKAHTCSSPKSQFDSRTASLTGNPIKGNDITGVQTKLSNAWKEKTEKERSMILANLLAAVYGSSNVANGIVADAAPSLPASLASLVRFSSAFIFFAPALKNVSRKKDTGILRAGAELAGLSFAGMLVDSCNPTSSGSSTSATILFAFTLVFASSIELRAGRHTGFTATRLATLAAISGMGLLEEEGSGWHGISLPHIDLWGTALSVIFGLHIFRSQVHAGRFEPLHLSAVQCGMLAALSLGWEAFSSFDPAFLQSHDLIAQVQNLPWAPLVYSGLASFGLCTWVEMHGLRSIRASTITLIYTTIPLWSAVLSFFAHHEMSNYMEPSMIGAAVILVTSVYAQTTTRKDLGTEDPSSALESTDSAPKSGEKSSCRGCAIGKDGAETKWQTAESLSKKISALQENLLTSQLKFPYYATQAKTLLADVKTKIGALKMDLFPTVSTSDMESWSDPSGLNTADGNVAAGQSSGIHVPGTLPQDSLLGSVDKSDIHVIAAHTAEPAVAASSLSTVHSTGNTMFAHTYADLTTGLQSALVTVGSVIVLGCEHAEDAASVLEGFVRSSVENAAHAIATNSPGTSAWPPNLSITDADVHAQATEAYHMTSGGNSTLTFLSHGVGVLFDVVIQHGSTLMHH